MYTHIFLQKDLLKYMIYIINLMIITIIICLIKLQEIHKYLFDCNFNFNISINIDNLTMKQIQIFISNSSTIDLLNNQNILYFKYSGIIIFFYLHQLIVATPFIIFFFQMRLEVFTLITLFYVQIKINTLNMLGLLYAELDLFTIVTIRRILKLSMYWEKISLESIQIIFIYSYNQSKII